MAGQRLFATTPEGIKKGLREIAPHVLIEVSWSVLLHHSWDGDGPDPREEGYSPYNVTVSARAIVGGEEEEGHAYLGVSYSKPNEHDPNIHGYFPQMVDEALSDLYRTISGVAPTSSRKAWDPRVRVTGDESLLLELRNAIKFTNVSMKEIYELEQRRQEREH